MKKITFIEFLDMNKLRYNKQHFMSGDQMYRAKIVNQYLRKFVIYCNQHSDCLNDAQAYRDEVFLYEQQIGLHGRTNTF